MHWGRGLFQSVSGAKEVGWRVPGNEAHQKRVYYIAKQAAHY